MLEKRLLKRLNTLRCIHLQKQFIEAMDGAAEGNLAFQKNGG
ncbi:hypothetical protein ABEW19_17825 [Paenibacillus illinoisensis]|nr:hypothetical protein [Paenibacillus illinoisensis]